MELLIWILKPKHGDYAKIPPMPNERFGKSYVTVNSMALNPVGNIRSIDGNARIQSDFLALSGFAIDKNTKLWTKNTYDALALIMQDGVYSNYMSDDEMDVRIQAAFGENYERLRRIKSKYDPQNYLKLNQNILPLNTDH